MPIVCSNAFRRLLLTASLLSIGAAAWAQPSTPDTSTNTALDSESASEVAKKLQNPIGDLINVPFQSNTYFDAGPHKGTQEILNIQPVIPIHINPDWNVITRTILPLIWQPSLQPAQTVPFGTGPITFSAFFSPSKPVDGWLWGVGPAIQVPVISNSSLGSNVWGAGPTGVIVYSKGPWVGGVLVNNVWSLGGTSVPGGTRYNNFLLQPFLTYNFKGGWFFGSSPIATANWLVSGDKAWTLPVGAQFGRVIKIGRTPVNLLLGAYYNTLRPQFGSTWQIRSQIAFVF